MTTNNHIEVACGRGQRGAHIAKLAVDGVGDQTHLFRNAGRRERHRARDHYDLIDIRHRRQRVSHIAIVKGNTAVPAIGIGGQQQHPHSAPPAKRLCTNLAQPRKPRSCLLSPGA